jgi:NAD(P)H-hydrate epimerase
MKVVTADQMRDIERRCAERGLPSEALMENAGLAFAQEIKRMLGNVIGCRIAALIGPGNNGGDGLVAARHLRDWGAKVYICLCAPRSQEDPNFKLVLERGIPCFQVGDAKELSAFGSIIFSAEVIIDALLGTGRLRPIEGAMKLALDLAREAKRKRPQMRVVALDLPSGLDADTGRTDPACLPADVTVTLGYPKLGLCTFSGYKSVGHLAVADIGIPPDLAEDVSTELITEEWAKDTLPQRPLDANKGTFGRVLVAAGSVNYIGAAYLACQGAMRVGAGLVTLATPSGLQPILASKLTEVTYAPLPEEEFGILQIGAAKVLQEWLPGYDVLLIGCGLGQTPTATEFVRDSLFSLPKATAPALVIDADALNTLAKTPQWWESVPDKAVLTPHPGEMGRLASTAAEEVQSDRLGFAQRTAAQWQKIVVLKGAHTVIAAPDGSSRLSLEANPGLASAGTGDVLAGAIAGLLAQGLSAFDAAALGVYLHGAAGEMVKRELGDTGMVASDLLPALPKVINKLKQQH